MSSNVLPFGSRSIVESEPHCVPEAVRAEVVDLAIRRAAASPVADIPSEVLDELDAAAQLWLDLREGDREVRFDTNAQSGRVEATLCDNEGGVVRALPLRELVRPDDDGPQTAA